MAATIAVNNPGSTVLLLDCSIHGDSSLIALGGTRAPLVHAPNIRTRGAERIAELRVAQPLLGTAALITAALAPPPQPQPSASGKGWGGFFAAAAAPAPAAPAFSWQQHSVRVTDAVPGGPQNLFVCPGGRELYNLVPRANVVPAIAKVRAALAASMGDNVFVIVDTDAELAERTASLIGLAIAHRHTLVLTSLWTDYQRILDDPANDVFTGLDLLTNLDPGYTGRVGSVAFNKVQLLHHAPAAAVCGAPGVLPFTPPDTALTGGVNQIAEHLYSMCINPATNYQTHFVDGAAMFASDTAFCARFVTGFAVVPITLWEQCMASGVSIARSTNAAAAAFRTQLNTVTARMLQ